MVTKEKTPKIMRVLLNEETPPEMRRDILLQLVNSEEEEARSVLERVLACARTEASEDLFAAKQQELAELIEQMMSGPLRQATFVSLIRSASFGLRAEVLLPDGAPAFTSVPDEEIANQLRCGDVVWLEAQGKALLYRQSHVEELGDEATIERQLSNGTVEVQVGEIGKFVYRVAAQLKEQLQSGEASSGSTVIVCPRRRFAFRALPNEEGFSNFRFLSRDSVPDVVVERDIGAPPLFIEQFTRHLRREMFDPQIGRSYGLRRSLSRMLTGVPGTGKTFSIQGFWNRMYTMMSEATGEPTADLPPRVMQLKVSDILSKWVGSSDRNIARFFAEATELVAEKLTLEDGTEVEMPLLIIIEECDAFGRERGEDAIHDRIQTTLLQHLDPSNTLFRDHLVFVVCTTNTPQLVDSAFVRRVGGKVENFGRLDRAGFRAVLGKQLVNRRFRQAGAGSSDQARSRCIADLVAWFFASNATQTGVVELTYVGQSTSVTKHHRDFLTAALIDRAVQDACEEACDAEWLGAEDPGLSTARLLSSLDGQVRQIAEALTAKTCDRYLTLPEGVRVASVVRIAQPAVLSAELERELELAS
jgi:ATP-dependent 26S proteasome regulatory subunit